MEIETTKFPPFGSEENATGISSDCESNTSGRSSPVVESLGNDSPNAPATDDKQIILKTPVAFLNEVCAKARTKPTFVVSEFGAGEYHMFNYTVKVDAPGFSCEGKH